MHGLLAFTALHLALSLPKEATKYAGICDAHEAQALAPYRHALKDITKDGLNALFAFSSILCMFSMGKAYLRASHASGPDYIALNDIRELIYLTRGVREIKETSSEALFRGPFWVMLLGNGFHTEYSVVLSHELRQTLRGLESMVHECCVDAEQLRYAQKRCDCLQGCTKSLCSSRAEVNCNSVTFGVGLPNSLAASSNCCKRNSHPPL
jgi:hypothetical protein